MPSGLPSGYPMTATRSPTGAGAVATLNWCAGGAALSRTSARSFSVSTAATSTRTTVVPKRTDRAVAPSTTWNAVATRSGPTRKPDPELEPEHPVAAMRGTPLLASANMLSQLAGAAEGVEPTGVGVTVTAAVGTSTGGCGEHPATRSASAQRSPIRLADLRI